MVEQWHQITTDPREEAVTGKAIGPPYPRSIGRDDAEAQRSRILIGRADIVATHKAAMAIHYRCPALVTVQRVSDAAPAGKCQLLVTRNKGHAQTLFGIPPTSAGLLGRRDR